MSSRILILVEGEAEDLFVRELLAPYLLKERGHLATAGYLAPNGSGVPSWGVAQKEFQRALKHDRAIHVSSMVDYYGMKHSWPGRARAQTQPKANRSKFVESAMIKALSLLDTLPERALERFHPYVALHEFEGLIFSDTDAAARGMGHPELSSELAKIRAGFSNPEEINDSAETAPGKRLSRLFELHGLSRYQKPLYGALASLEIGLETIRRECPHFAQWVAKLYNLP
jgi:hypothetical protein